MDESERLIEELQSQVNMLEAKHTKQLIYHEAMDAVSHNNIDKIRSLIKNYHEYFDIQMYNSIMVEAALSNKIDIVKLMIKHGANNFDQVMEEAADRGYINIVLLMLEMGANNYNYGIRFAQSPEIRRLLEFARDNPTYFPSKGVKERRNLPLNHSAYAIDELYRGTNIPDLAGSRVYDFLGGPRILRNKELDMEYNLLNQPEYYMSTQNLFEFGRRKLRKLRKPQKYRRRSRKSD